MIDSRAIFVFFRDPKIPDRPVDPFDKKEVWKIDSFKGIIDKNIEFEKCSIKSSVSAGVSGKKRVKYMEHLIPASHLPQLSVPQLFSWWRLFRNHTSLYTSDCALLVRFSFDCALVFVSTSVCFRPCVRLWFIPIFIFFVGLFSFLFLFLFSFSVSCPSLVLFSFLLPF